MVSVVYVLMKTDNVSASLYSSIERIKRLIILIIEAESRGSWKIWSIFV